jgi:ketosteroid isomerase-like protein
VNPETIALIHSVYDAMNRRDIETLRRLAHENPDYVWSNGVDMPEPGLRDGIEGTAYVEEFFRAFDRNHTTVREVIDIGDDRVIFMVHHSVRGAVSGAVVERDEVHLWRTVDGRLAGLDEFLTLDEARAAAAGA